MIAAFSFLTCFGTGAVPNAKTARWFGVVGLALGVVLGAWWSVVYRWQEPFIAAVLVVALDAALTGMLHFDGLADSGDGLVAPMDRERRLVVMRTPDVGAFGVVVVVLVLMLRVEALGALAPNLSGAYGFWLLVALWMTSRAAVAFVMATVPYARAEGLAAAFTGDRALAAFATLTVLAAGYLCFGWRNAWPVVGAVVSAFVVTAFARRRIGGYTGDVLGAMILISETVGLLVASGIAR